MKLYMSLFSELLSLPLSLSPSLPLSPELKLVKTEVVNNSTKLSKLETKIQEVQEHSIANEQYRRKNNVRIFGLHEDAGENCVTTVFDLVTIKLGRKFDESRMSFLEFRDRGIILSWLGKEIRKVTSQNVGSTLPVSTTDNSGILKLLEAQQQQMQHMQDLLAKQQQQLDNTLHLIDA